MVDVLKRMVKRYSFRESKMESIINQIKPTAFLLIKTFWKQKSKVLLMIHYSFYKLTLGLRSFNHMPFL